MVWPRFSAARLSGLAVAAIVMLSPVAARGQYTWTGNANRTWDTSSLNWTLGSGNIAWVTSNPAVFGATGAGAVAVSGTQTVTGTGLTVNAAGYSFTGGSITLGSATTTFNIANDTTIGSVVAGSNQLVKTGAGALTFTGANTYSGTTTISEGALRFANGVSNLPGDVINNATMIFGGTSGASYSGVNKSIGGSGNLFVQDGVLLANSGVTWSYSGTTSVTGGLLSKTTFQMNGGNSRLSQSAAVVVTGGEFMNGQATSSNDGVSNRINPSASLTLGGAMGGGDLRMGNPAAGSSHTQQLASLAVGQGVSRLYTNNSTGTTQIGFNNAAASNYSKVTGGVLNVVPVAGFQVSFTNLPSRAVGSGSAAILPGALFDDNLAGFAAGASYVVAAPAYVDTGTTTWTGNANMNVTGNVSLGAGAALQVNSIRFASATQYSVTLPSSGTTAVASGMVLNASTSSGVSSIGGGAITSGYTNDSGVNELMVFDRRNVGRNNNGFTINSAIVDNGSLPVALTLSSAPNISGGTIQIDNVGAVVLGGANTYSGGTFIAGITVKFAADSAFGKDPGTAGASTPSVRVFGNGVGGTSGGGLRPTVSGTYIWNQNRSIALVNAAFTLDASNGPMTFVMPASISGSGALRTGAAGGGVLVLSGSNSYQGPTSVLSGSLQIGAGGTTGSLHPSSPISIASGASLVFARTDGYGGAFANTITGTGGVRVASGMLTLSGSSSYSGATTIAGGRLEIGSSGQINGTSGITINGSGAELKYNSATSLTQPITFTQGTLSGTGTIGTAVTAGANDILSPGNSPGAQSFTSGLTWDPAGSYLWEMNDATGGNGTGWDIINVSGGSGLVINATSGTTFKIAITSLSGTAAGNAANFSATTSGSWTILSSASGITGFAAHKFTLDRSAFANTASGSFTISQVASGTNQTLVLAYNTISALSSSTSSVTGFRVMQGQSTTTAVNLLNAGPDATGYSLSPSAGLSLVSGSTGTLAGSGTQAITFGYVSTAATGARSGTVSFTNTGNSGDAGGSVSVSGAVVTDRVVTASVVDFGLVHLGASGTGTSTFTSTGSDNDFTRITVGNGTGGGLTVSGSSDFVFNGSGGSSRTVAGTFATAGALSGTISLTNASAEAGGTLPGQVPGTTGLAYSASVFSGTATWNVAGGGSWGSGASGSWTSTGGVQAAPGTFIGYANTDVAIFAGTQGGTSTVLLNGATPSLAAISFTNTANRYVIDQGSGGSLALATSSGKPTIDVVAGGLHEIKTAILGSAGLAKLGGGTLVLSGSNGFTGGTDVAGGTLAVSGFLGGPVDVANGATLAGSGQVGGAVTVAGGGILAPGNSPGTLTMGSGLSLADASILSFELDATNFNVGGGINDLIAVTGNFTLDGLLNVAALGAGDFTGVATGAKWTLFTYTGDLTNNSLTLNSMPLLGGDRTYAIDTSTSGVVALIVVPEPATVAMAVSGVALAVGIGARRRKTRAAGR
jgi:fibronectin-binding autotransporter adhesin